LSDELPYKVRKDGVDVGTRRALNLIQGDGHRFADLGAANNPSGWAGAIKVKKPDGVTAGYILLYSNP